MEGEHSNSTGEGGFGINEATIISTIKRAPMMSQRFLSSNEDYPDYSKGPCVLILQHDHEGRPVHVVWGMPKGKTSPAILVTAYRPTPDVWKEVFKRRIK
jgi:hypothetical protein